jgi:acetyl-CoA carboxylase carboxyltransferase component
MATIASKINPNSNSFKENYQKMQLKLEELNKNLKKSHFQGQEKHIERALSKGKMTARERIEMLIDQDSVHF